MLLFSAIASPLTSLSQVLAWKSSNACISEVPKYLGATRMCIQVFSTESRVTAHLPFPACTFDWSMCTPVLLCSQSGVNAWSISDALFSMGSSWPFPDQFNILLAGPSLWSSWLRSSTACQVSSGRRTILPHFHHWLECL